MVCAAVDTRRILAYRHRISPVSVSCILKTGIDRRQESLFSVPSSRMDASEPSGLAAVPGAGAEMGIGEDKKRVAKTRSPDRSTDDVAQHRRVKGRSEWASSGGLDDVESALPETLDLSGRNDVSSAAMRILLDAQPKTSILKLDGCLVRAPPL